MCYFLWTLSFATSSFFRVLVLIYSTSMSFFVYVLCMFW